MLPLWIGGELIGIITMLRSKDMGEFSEDELLILSKINTLISGDLKVQLDIEKTAYEYNTFGKSMNQMPIGLVILDSKLSPLYFNEAARSFFAEISGGGTDADSVQRSIRLLVSTLPPSDAYACPCHTVDICDRSVKITLFPARGVTNTVETVYALHITHPFLPDRKRLLVRHFGLTSRETEIVKLIENGYSNQGISDALIISLHTVKTHIENIYKKMKVNSRTSMIHKINETVSSTR
jgi:DNA-binding CsgD family transcriptional regulator